MNGGEEEIVSDFGEKASGKRLLGRLSNKW
jgi:hypothetical protein